MPDGKIPNYLAAATQAAADVVAAMGAIRVQPPKESAAKKQAMNNCLDIIRSCVLQEGGPIRREHDGAIRLNSGGDPADINPYFAHHAALALLAANPTTAKLQKEADLKIVENWLKWVSKHQDKDTGVINDFAGSLSAGCKDKGSHDSVDSYAAMYLVVADEYLKAMKKAGKRPDAGTLKIITEGGLRSLKAIDSVVDNEDGLTWAKPNYKVKYLADNIEVRAGLKAGASFFAVVGKKDESKDAAAKASKMDMALSGFWQNDKFAWAKQPNGIYESGLKKSYPHGMANLFGMAHISDEKITKEMKTKLFSELEKNFKPDNGPAAEAPVERWLLAALATGDKNVIDKYSKLTFTEARNFEQSDIYVHRPAVAVLAMTSGQSWLSGKGLYPDQEVKPQEPPSPKKSGPSK